MGGFVITHYLRILRPDGRDRAATREGADAYDTGTFARRNAARVPRWPAGFSHCLPMIEES